MNPVNALDPDGEPRVTRWSQGSLYRIPVFGQLWRFAFDFIGTKAVAGPAETPN